MPPKPQIAARGFRLRRFDATTGVRRRWSWRAIAGALALALFSGSAIAVASVSVAQAHSADYTASCTGVTVHASSYQPEGSQPGQANTITFQVDGGEVETFSFGSSTTKSFFFPNSTEAHNYNLTVTAWDDSSWNKQWLNLSSTPCVRPGILSLSAPRCDVVNGSTDLTAKFGDLVAGRHYSLTLASDAPSSTATDYQPSQASPEYTWPDVVPGRDYTVTITDSTNSDLTATKTVAVTGCPQESGIRVDTTQCSAPDHAGVYSVTALELVVGRQYRIDLFAGGNVLADSVTFTANSAQFTHDFAAVPLESYYASVTDVQDSQLVATSNASGFLPCPVRLDEPALTLSQCVDTAGSDAAIGISTSNLVPGRQYRVTVTDGSGATVSSDTFLAEASTWSTALPNLPTGTYTVTVTDVLLPSFTASSRAQLESCPSQPSLALSAAQCSEAGGTAQITAVVTDFVVGRGYTVTLTQAGIPVDGPHDKVAPDSSSWRLPIFTGLAPNKVYRVLVVDTLVPTVVAAADISLGACPGMPKLAITNGTCSLLGASPLHVALTGLADGQTYTVSVTETGGDQPVDGVLAQTVDGDVGETEVVFENVPNGHDYTVTIKNESGRVSVSATTFLPICDLPTLPFDDDLATLAFTGSEDLPISLLGLALIQLGLVLVGLSLVRRRANQS
ncbi:MAG: RTX toxin [Salinibacterium sp.]|nr:MAG: RTX toxin [Salinibacterium sp.]